MFGERNIGGTGLAVHRDTTSSEAMRARLQHASH